MVVVYLDIICKFSLKDKQVAAAATILAITVDDFK